MWWVVLGHLGVPFVFGVAFVVFATASGRNPPTWDIALETALDCGGAWNWSDWVDI